MPPRYPSSKLPFWRDVCNNRVWTKVFLNTIYRQKVTPNPCMQFDMKEIKNKINGDRLKQPLATPCAPKRWSPIFVHCLCTKMLISNLCPLLVRQNVDFQSLSIACAPKCRSPIFVHCLCAKMLISNLCPSLVKVACLVASIRCHSHL